MSELEKLLERMRRVEALYARTDVAGERAAAGSAREAILAQLQRYQTTDPAEEYKLSIPDAWSRRLFLALARRYGLEPYRYHGQRRTTVMLRVSRTFLHETLWPEFDALSKILFAHLEDVTEQVISQSFGSSGSDDAVIKESSGALPAPS